MNHFYELRPVMSAEDWRRLHEIRRTVLFRPGRQSVAYDENHPDDRAADNVPYLLHLDDRRIGVVRLDFRGEIAIVRLVAIAADEQGKGHGRQLDALVATEAKRRGVKSLHVNAAPEAVGYYEKMGWKRAGWDPDELTGIARNCTQMTKQMDG
ncbi:GNAT family N-acetyltransferase [Phyllobacterium leguminum]|uniref:Acetyltransferase (GNAT) family protein n=1 Tax=Phyllobacterium leguminum TaxID=314237 RepID=A0A318SY94_9HYPH|nr:GNAT family N-acetyltransferase [Phyllobacterium leguminum]PYE86413.1 acetyltransferase (GNAT) family protein [Phyllobacterium leguminum]